MISVGRIPQAQAAGPPGDGPRGFHGGGYRRPGRDARPGGLEGVRQRTEIVIGVCHSPNRFPASSSATAICGRRNMRAGRRRGSRTVPARSDEEGAHWVTVLPVTHAPPSVPELAVEIPAAPKRRLGLDDERSWVVLTEANRFLWPGPAGAAGRHSERRLWAAAVHAFRGNPDEVHRGHQGAPRRRCAAKRVGQN